MNKIANSCIKSPKLWAVLTKKGSANQPRMDQFQKCSTISCIKFKLKGSLKNKKIANSGI